MKNVLITGAPGSGKSTVVQQLYAGLGGSVVGGMLSGEIRVDGRRQGFTVEVLGTGQKGVLASPDLPGEPRFGTMMPDGRRRLGLSLDFLDNVICPELEAHLRAGSIVLIDEIGGMQAESSRFRTLIDRLIGGVTPFLASITTAEHSWIESVRDSPNVGVLEVTPRNRDLLPHLVATYLAQRGQP
jgi:nucleoside-triphosphatase